MAMADEIATHDRYSYARSAEEIGFNERAREVLSRIPGHAQYFAESIENARTAAQNIPLNVPGARTTYDRHRGWAISTLARIPSPETVKVLGRLLLDDRDYPERHDPDVMANSDYALDAFKQLGLRSPPARRKCA